MSEYTAYDVLTYDEHAHAVDEALKTLHDVLPMMSVASKALMLEFYGLICGRQEAVDDAVTWGHAIAAATILRRRLRYNCLQIKAFDDRYTLPVARLIAARAPGHTVLKKARVHRRVVATSFCDAVWDESYWGGPDGNLDDWLSIADEDKEELLLDYRVRCMEQLATLPIARDWPMPWDIGIGIWHLLPLSESDEFDEDEEEEGEGEESKEDEGEEETEEDREEESGGIRIGTDIGTDNA